MADKDVLPAKAKEDKGVADAPVTIGNIDAGATGASLNDELGKGAKAVAAPEPKTLGQNPGVGGVFVAQSSGKVKRAEDK